LKFKRLKDIKKQPLFRGTIIRVPAKGQWESVVDLMVYDPELTGFGMAIIIDSGYSAGFTLACYPKESLPLEARAICSEWLRKNWSKWNFTRTKLDDVWVSSTNRYPPKLPKESN
jgi:hypothetical protein